MAKRKPNRQAKSNLPRAASPAASKRTLTASCRSGSLQEKRQAAIDDAQGYSRLVPLQTFFRSQMPPVDLRLVKDVIKSLRSGQNPVIVGKRWADFQVDPAKSNHEVEEVIFRPLVDIMKAIAKAATVASSGGGPRCTYESNPNAVPESESRDNLTRPDGWIIRMGGKSSGKEAHWMDMAATGEFKKKENETTTADNNNKMLWSLQHCMVDDARRRFAFGFTIENTSMRLWWCNRGLVVVSSPFNFVRDHTNFVRFVLGMLFSNETELGWDPTLTRLENGQFDMEWHSKSGEKQVYRTLKLISDYGADALIGPAGRVWIAQRVVSGELIGDPAILKDIWIEDDRKREGDIIQEICDSLPADDRPESSKPFLTVLCHGDVLVPSADNTTHPDNHTLHLHGRFLSETCPIYRFTPAAVRKVPFCPLKTAVGTHHTEAMLHERYREPERISISPKTHYRIVFKEVCRPIHDELSLPSVFKGLSQMPYALQLMHSAGWAHRNINTGSILLDCDGNVKLGDLEYAKEMNDENSHPSLMLNSDFVALEVQKRAYLFLDGKLLKPRKGNANHRIRVRYLASVRGEPPTPRSRDSDFDFDPCEAILVFKHIPLHDHESLWWVIAYFVFRRRLVGDNRCTDCVNKQERTASLIFKERLLFLTSHNALTNELSCLPSSIFALGAMLENMRAALGEAYKEASFYPGSWKEALDAIEKFMSTIDEKLSSKIPVLHGFMLQPLTLPDEEPEANKVNIDEEKPDRKRKREIPQDATACPECRRNQRAAKRVRLECNAPSSRTRSQTAGQRRQHQ